MENDNYIPAPSPQEEAIAEGTYEEQALYEDYREELYRDRRRRLGWEDEDENFDDYDDSDRMQSSSGN
jgi:predicted amidohydrolase